MDMSPFPLKSFHCLVPQERQPRLLWLPHSQADVPSYLITASDGVTTSVKRGRKKSNCSSNNIPEDDEVDLTPRCRFPTSNSAGVTRETGKNNTTINFKSSANLNNSLASDLNILSLNGHFSDTDNEDNCSFGSERSNCWSGCRQKTILFDVVEEGVEQSRFAAVTVGQVLVDGEHSYSQKVQRAGDPQLPPSYMIWIKVTTDYGSQKPDKVGLYLHWGVSLATDDWRLPLNLTGLPIGSCVWQNSAIRTPMLSTTRGLCRYTLIDLGPTHQCPVAFRFVLFASASQTWIKCGGNSNFVVPLQSMIAELQMELVRESVLNGLKPNGSGALNLNESWGDVALWCPTIPDVHHIFGLPRHNAELDVLIWTSDEAVVIEIITNLREEVILHWGLLSIKPVLSETSIANQELTFDNDSGGFAALDLANSDSSNEEWEPPDSRMRPPDNIENGDSDGAVQTLFHRGLRGPEASLIQSVRLVFPYDIILQRCVEGLTSDENTDGWIWNRNDITAPSKPLISKMLTTVGVASSPSYKDAAVE